MVCLTWVGLSCRAKLLKRGTFLKQHSVRQSTLKGPRRPFDGRRQGDIKKKPVRTERQRSPQVHLIINVANMNRSAKSAVSNPMIKCATRDTRGVRIVDRTTRGQRVSTACVSLDLYLSYSLLLFLIGGNLPAHQLTQLHLFALVTRNSIGNCALSCASSVYAGDHVNIIRFIAICI